MSAKPAAVSVKSDRSTESGHAPHAVNDEAALATLRADRLARRRRYARELQQWVPENAVLASEEQLRPYESDGLTALKATPLLVVLPETIEQVQAIMRWARDNAVPVVARGAGTGLSGGALPHEDGLLLGLAKFNRILELNHESGYARVQPGVRNLAISDAARPLGLYYAPDPSSQIACTIGGNVAENSGGVHCLKYGLSAQCSVGHYRHDRWRPAHAGQ